MIARSRGRSSRESASANFVSGLLAALVLLALGAHAAPTLSPEQLQTTGWLPTRVSPVPFTAEWLAARYGAKVGSVDFERFQTPGAWISIASISAPDAASRDRLWKGLERDKLPNQLLVRKGMTISVVASSDLRERDKALKLVEPERTSETPSRFAWIADEFPVHVPGLAFSQSLLRADLMALETKVGIELDVVYQADYRLRTVGVGHQLSQAALWIPRDASKLAELSRKLPELRPEQQTILTGKGAVVAVLSFNDEGRRQLVELLQSKGYRVEPGPESYKRDTGATSK